MLRHFLEGNGYSVCMAADGQQALRLMEKYHADLIITDILMPEKDGLEVVTAVRQKWPKVPVVAISGGGAHLHPTQIRQMAKALGATRFFDKPVELNELLAVVRELLPPGPRPASAAFP